MDRKATRERWQTLLAQASHLAALDNTLDAAARLRRLVAETRRELAGAPAEERRWMERELLHQESELARVTALHDAWKARVAGRQAEAVAREQSLYTQPIPVPAPR